ncbi:MAG TPA: hypothetical protein DEB10_02005 [Ruminococcaceae bacterium]|nr:hypothetical protein [Oscillospiraceae bacterium]HCA30018.1 hypothetical protein [Oscillospiraceae bacterium]
MKKYLSIAAAVMLIATTFSGCKKEETAGDKVKTGLAVISSIEKSSDVKDGTGLAQMDSTVVAVTVDKDDRIVKCVIDSVQTKINFDATGKITTPLDTEFKTKNERKEDYGMKKASGIGKEWYEQAAAFAKYVEGKTANEVAGIAVNQQKYPTGPDLTASVTMAVGDLIEGVKKAVSNARDKGSKASDKLGLGIVTNIEKSTDATDAKAGLAQAYSYYTATTTDADGKITSCVLDASQTDVNFDNTGKITSDLTVEQKTKNQLGDAYGMKKASKIGKEWNEQAASFADYVIGKTVSQVKGIAVDEAEHPTGSDLTSSVTMSVGGLIGAIEKAAAGAK